MRKDYLQRAMQGGTDQDTDVGPNFMKKLRVQESLRSDHEREGGKRMSHRWKPEDEDRYKKFQNLKANLDAMRSGTEVAQDEKYVPSSERPQEQRNAPAEAPKKNAMLEKILKMGKDDQKKYTT